MDKTITISLRTTGDVSGAMNVSQALSGLGQTATAAGSATSAAWSSAATAATSTSSAGQAVTTTFTAAGQAAAAAGRTGRAAMEEQIRAAMEFNALLQRLEAQQRRMSLESSSAQAHRYAQAWMDLNNRVQYVAPALRQAASATGNLAEQQQRATRSTMDWGMASLQASYFVDDVQYGIRGIVNNIPLLLMSFGVSGGLTGIISILAVALAQAVTKFDLFGGAAEKAAKKAREASNESREAAEKARDAAEKTAEIDAVWWEHIETIEAVSRKYRQLKEDIAGAQAARERMNRMALEEEDAQAANDLAEIEARRSEGNLSDSDAETQGRAVRDRVRKKRYTLEQEEMRKREEEQRADAAGAGEELAAKTRENEALNAATRNLLTNEARKQAETEAATIEKMIAEERAKIKAAPQRIRELSFEDRMARFGPNADLNAPNPDLQNMRQHIRDYQVKYEDLRKLLEADSEAQVNPAKAKDADQVRQLNAEFAKWKQEREREIAKSLSGADLTKAERESKARVEALNDKTSLRESGTRITNIQTRENQERERERQEDEREKERKEREKERADRKAERDDRQEGRDVADAVRDFGRSRTGGRGGRNSRGGGMLQQLTDRANALRDGIDGGELGALSSALDALANGLAFKSSADQKALSTIWKMVHELKKQAATSRD